MKAAALENAERARAWLSQSALPLWTGAGFDEKTGTFVEALSPEGRPLDAPRRAMVQARQIYAARTAAKLGCLPRERAQELARRAAAGMVEGWGLPSGAFLKSIDAAGRPADETPDLYTQAFAMFGLANAYALQPDAALKKRALSVAGYLERERRAAGGGYTELEGGRAVLRSNPHMHLYEAFLAWAEVDADARWKALAEEILELCLTRFIDPATGCLAEVFEDGWRPAAGREGFLFEPGHHFEWAWLMTVHRELGAGARDDGAAALYHRAHQGGVGADGFAFDEVWSAGPVKKRSARFWPQGERAKAAVRLGRLAPEAERAAFARHADEALAALWRYLETPVAGLWSDQRLEDGRFVQAPARASALYHIINAFDEYLTHRPSL